MIEQCAVIAVLIVAAVVAIPTLVFVVALAMDLVATGLEEIREAASRIRKVLKEAKYG